MTVHHIIYFNDKKHTNATPPKNAPLFLGFRKLRIVKQAHMKTPLQHTFSQHGSTSRPDSRHRPPRGPQPYSPIQKNFSMKNKMPPWAVSSFYMGLLKIIENNMLRLEKIVN